MTSAHRLTPAPQLYIAPPPAKPPEIPLDITTIGCISRHLTAARRELHMAYLFARQNKLAKAELIAAAATLRAAGVLFEEAYKRGRL